MSSNCSLVISLGYGCRTEQKIEAYLITSILLYFLKKDYRQALRAT